MFAAIRVYGDNEGFADALVANESGLREVISGIEGFGGYYLVKTADGVASISVYETVDGADESSRAAAAWVKENLPEHVKSPPQVTVGELVIDSGSWS